ncbi:MAG: DNA mismatch repair endonuclease MutL, partial [Actinomycetota bacterium]|nr:DNA mismatch repair endonuclease MutL [Actinomycetota bacterium]
MTDRGGEEGGSHEHDGSADVGHTQRSIGTGEDQDGKERRIRLLSNALVDQIAAGEVVERPASVVKELVENALDAGARRIRVEVRDGGAAFIGVTDDGFGMSPDDVRMALLRHATSKLRAQGDLERISSFGFRGEALPSIASVSRLRIVSRERGADEGFEVRLEAGEVVRESAAGGPVGTRIEVADLFAPVPARRKFLKKSGTEWGHIADWLSRLALSLPGVHFEIQRDDRPATVWPACASTRDRIAQVLPSRDAESLVEIEREEATGHIHAFASPPTHHRANGEGLYLYVNGRPVRDKLLRSAVLAAYRDILPRGRFPVAVVFVTVPPETVDVNVHPAKWEVRFADPQSVHQLVRRAVRDAMSERAWLSGESPPTVQASPRESAGGPSSHASPPPSRPAAAAPTTTDWIFAREAERLGEPRGAADGGDVVTAPLAPDLRADVGSERRPFRFGELHRLG